ncbi:putative T7SS-secreted protein [Curtobacterium sp. MCLR17_054]|uniref:putative T7SS-secreted protein n=1 Tax=Curtobacterium sp. MCLR17_054 TaxID=2175632 RepID=UPI0032E7FD38
MGRPSGWDVVDQGDDPVKGDPLTLRMMAREYQRISDAADDASTRLKSVKGSGWLTDWEGEAADVFVDAIEDTPSDLTKLVDSYELAATALSGWADTVDDTQYRADGALADAKDATGDLAAAQDRLADAQSTLSHYESASKDLSKVADKYPAGSDVPDGVDVPSPAQLRAASDNASVAQGSVSSAQGDISAAQSRIDAAKRLVADAKGDWQDAEQRTATKIGEAADAGLGKQSTWDKIFGSEAWETIVSVAKVVVAVGGIIAMIIPGPWTLIIAAIALVVLADTLYKMSKGEADGWDLAFSLLDCVPAAGALGRLASLGKYARGMGGISRAGGRVLAAGRSVIGKAKSAVPFGRRVELPLGVRVNPNGRTLARTATKDEKAAFGEQQMHDLYARSGFDRIDTKGSTSANGLDGVYFNKKTGEYEIGEAKFSKHDDAAPNSLLKNTKLSGRQLSDQWIDSPAGRDALTRLERAVDERHFDAIQKLLDEGKLPRSVVVVGHDGGSTRFMVDTGGKVIP